MRGGEAQQEGPRQTSLPASSHETLFQCRNFSQFPFLLRSSVLHVESVPLALHPLHILLHLSAKISSLLKLKQTYTLKLRRQLQIYYMACI